LTIGSIPAKWRRRRRRRRRKVTVWVSYEHFPKRIQEASHVDFLWYISPSGLACSYCPSMGIHSPLSCTHTTSHQMVSSSHVQHVFL
jgi:hypothetical protein